MKTNRKLHLLLVIIQFFILIDVVHASSTAENGDKLNINFSNSLSVQHTSDILYNKGRTNHNTVLS